MGTTRVCAVERTRPPHSRAKPPCAPGTAVECLRVYEAQAMRAHSRHGPGPLTPDHLPPSSLQVHCAALSLSHPTHGVSGSFSTPGTPLTLHLPIVYPLITSSDPCNCKRPQQNSPVAATALPAPGMAWGAGPLGCRLLTVALGGIWDNLEAQWSPPPNGSNHQPSDTCLQTSGSGAGLCGGLSA